MNRDNNTFDSTFLSAKRVVIELLRGERGISAVSAIEFAILGPALALMLVMGSDLGLAFYSDMQVQTAAQSGAEYAAIHGFDATAISTAVTSATSATGISTSPAPNEFCGCSSDSTITAVTCGSTCSDGMTAGTYVQVTAVRSYSTIIPYPMLPTSYTQTATSTVRIK